MKPLLPVLAVSALLVSAPPFAQTDEHGVNSLLSTDRNDGFGKPDSSPFLEPALTVHAAPAAPVSYELPVGLTVRDFEVSPAGDQVALVTEDAAHRQQLAFWRYGTGGAARTVEVPAGTRVASVTWRPDAGRLFLLATDARGSRILGLDPLAEMFAATTIYTSRVPLRRLVVGPRPFAGSWTGAPAYRLFFGQQLPDGGFALRAVNEAGKAPYTVVGPTRDPQYAREEFEPNTTIAASALPVGFHPAGNALIWEDGQRCLHKKPYQDRNWGDSVPFGGHCGAIIAYAPNGAATLEWAAGKPGLRVRGLIDGSDRVVLDSYHLLSVPSQTPDGRGLVGLTRDGGRSTLQYLPLSLPLADVANAWMFLGGADDQQRFVRDGGLFRNLPNWSQLYELNDSEFYSYKQRLTATRPYFVTTDLFWEVYGAAFDGLFIVIERERAMPAFQTFVHAVTSSLQQSAPGTAVARAFSAIQAVLEHGEAGSPEAQRILNAQGTAVTPVGEELDYSQLQPRGHYKTEAQQRYFRAMRYLSLLRLSRSDAATLRGLGPQVAKAAEDWIGSYRPFIAPSRLDLVWGNETAKTPIASGAGPAGDVGMFPVSWAWDNEALNNVIYHNSWPRPEQIVAADGRPRLLPSGLDFAAILGNADAKQLLDEEGLLATYPDLAARIAATARRFAADRERRPPGSLYEKWISALATQWADAARVPEISGRLWDVKRLQTGLASWATLRHSSILVNDQAAAEAGEGGFEDIVMAPPRGYVEPDPATFGAIADLFDATAAMVKSTPLLASDPAHDPEVRDGIIRRLMRSRDDVRQFEAIARKELAGQPLDPDDYAAIAYVGGTVEHNFLVFMSLSNPSYALSTPDPMMKIADVAGTRDKLEVAVGRPLEWDQIVPFYGCREIVQGAIYSYYELTAPEPIDDARWWEIVDAQDRPPWVAPFLSPIVLVPGVPEP
jgi:hypothetical protein